MSDAAQSLVALAGINRLAEGLAKHNLAIYGLAYDYLHFGSWTIEVGRRHKRILLQWDGKESWLVISVAVVSDAQSAKDWKRVAEQAITLQADADPTVVFESAKHLALKFADT
jgi:hypothetical protein